MQSVVCFVLLAAVASAQSKPEVGPDTVVMTLGGKPVTKAEFDKLASGFQAATKVPLDLTKNLMQQLGEIYALDEAARKRGLADDPAIASHIRFRTAQLLGAELFKAVQADINKDEAKLRAYYDAKKSEYLLPRVRQILVTYKGARGADAKVTRTQAEAEKRAKDLRAKLDAGANFEALAKAESDDPGAARSGGMLGEIMRGQTLPAFEMAVFNLKKGQIAGPIKTEQGFHIAIVEDLRALEFDKLRATLVYELARQDVDAIASKGFTINESVLQVK